MLLLLVLTYLQIPWHIPPLQPSSTIYKSWLISLMSLFLTFEISWYAKPEAVKKPTGSISYISRNIFRKFSNTFFIHSSSQADKHFFDKHLFFVTTVRK